MIWSDEQDTIFAAAERHLFNIMISALAGTGKTTTLVELAHRLPSGSKLFCAFNKSIVAELGRRLEGTGVDTKTLHALGFGALARFLKSVGVSGKIDVDKYKYRNIVKEWAFDNPRLKGAAHDLVEDLPAWRKSKGEREIIGDVVDMADDLLTMLRLHLVDPGDAEGLQKLVEQYRLDDDIYNDSYIVMMVIRQIPTFMAQAEAQTLEGKIDFTDQLYWNVYGFDDGVNSGQRLYPQLPVYDYVMVDEAQDLSELQREMISRCVGKRIFLVGDKNQAIYAFAGADADSFEKSILRFNCQVYPLTLTFRCPKLITRHAASIVPEFRCAEDKHDGRVVWLPEQLMIEAARPGDAILSRKRAPLVLTVFQFIAAGKPATILGRDIGASLTKIINKMQRYAEWDFRNIQELLVRYREEQVLRYTRRNDQAMVDKTRDECDALYTVIANTEPGSLEQLLTTINSLFSEAPDGRQIVLSTIHKAKGLEFPRVFILYPQDLPLEWKGITPEQTEQEEHLDYIARTRAFDDLVYLVTFEYLLKHSRPSYITDTLDVPLELESGK